MHLSAHSRVMAVTLCDLNQQDEASVAAKISAFVKLAGSDPHTFLFTMAVLRRLQQELHAPWVQRIANDLVNHVASQYG